MNSKINHLCGEYTIPMDHIPYGKDQVIALISFCQLIRNKSITHALLFFDGNHPKAIERLGTNKWVSFLNMSLLHGDV